MSIFDVIWLFFLLSSLQPVLQKWYLSTQRARAFRGLEKRRESRVIGLIHRQETMAFLGFPVARYIDIEDSEAVLRAIQLTDRTVPIDMILHTPGGLVLAASQIASALARARGQGDGVRAALRHEWRDADFAGSRRDCHGAARGARGRWTHSSGSIRPPR